MKTLSEEEKIKHCVGALKTADIIFNLATQFRDKLSLEDHRCGDDLNPCYHQTAVGLLLEFWGSRPVGVVTPWGVYYFGGWCEFSVEEQKERAVWKRIFPQLESQLGLILFKPKSEIKVETIHGDLWAIGVGPVGTGEISLPNPQERGYSCFEAYNTACKEWRKLVKQVRENVPI